MQVNYRHFEDDMNPRVFKREGLKHLDRVIDIVRDVGKCHVMKLIVCATVCEVWHLHCHRSACRARRPKSRLAQRCRQRSSPVLGPQGLPGPYCNHLGASCRGEPFSYSMNGWLILVRSTTSTTPGSPVTIRSTSQQTRSTLACWSSMNVLRRPSGQLILITYFSLSTPQCCCVSDGPDVLSVAETPSEPTSVDSASHYPILYMRATTTRITASQTLRRSTP